MSRKRKYAPIWNELKDKKSCSVRCSREATHTIILMVAKEKTLDKDRPKGMRLTNEVTETGITFRLVEDLSINNL